MAVPDADFEGVVLDVDDVPVPLDEEPVVVLELEDIEIGDDFPLAK